MSSLRTGIRVLESYMIGLGFRSSRVLENWSEKLRRLRVYEKGGSSVVKNFLFIRQLLDLALI